MTKPRVEIRRVDDDTVTVLGDLRGQYAAVSHTRPLGLLLTSADTK